MAPDVHLVALGPLTNIALAIVINPSFTSHFGQNNFTIMGGAHHGKGNATYSSEFNIHGDPEAAAICFSGISMTNLVSYEITEDNDLHWDFYDNILGAKKKCCHKIFI